MHLNRLKQLPYEFHVGMSTGELIEAMVKALEDAPPIKGTRTFTESQLEAFCRKVLLRLLDRAVGEGITDIKDLIAHLQESDNAGDEWKDQ